MWGGGDGQVRYQRRDQSGSTLEENQLLHPRCDCGLAKGQCPATALELGSKVSPESLDEDLIHTERVLTRSEEMRFLRQKILRAWGLQADPWGSWREEFRKLNAGLAPPSITSDMSWVNTGLVSQAVRSPCACYLTAKKEKLARGCALYLF